MHQAENWDSPCERSMTEVLHDVLSVEKMLMVKFMS